MAPKSSSLLLLLLLLFSVVFSSTASGPCVYTLFVRTGRIVKGGTDANISVQLYDANGYYLTIDNLVDWGGLMGPYHNYYERGNLDVFSGLGGCLRAPICGLNLTSDGSGDHAGWYCNYVEVTMTGPHIQCKQHQFTVEQWLATDASPYELTAIRNDCDSVTSQRSTSTSLGKGWAQT